MAVLNLDPVQDINEGQSAVLTGSLSDFEPDSEVTLVIDWGEVDINGNPITDGSDEVTVTATTDANGNLDLASLDLTYLYTDDNPTATPAYCVARPNSSASQSVPRTNSNCCREQTGQTQRK